MRRLSDYKGDEAIELWSDLISPISKIMQDKKAQTVFKDKDKSMLEKASEVISLHKEEAEAVILRIDPTPINGLNLITRVLEFLVEIETSEDLKPFFALAGQGKTESASSGSAMASTEGAEN